MIRRRCALVLPLVVVFLLSAEPTADQKTPAPVPLPSIAPLDLARLLDLYAAGRFDEAVQSVARAGDEVGRNLRRHWAVAGRAWIDADPGQRQQRALAAAALALETENIRAERGDWRVTDSPPCAAACVLDWAQIQLVQRGRPDGAEHVWYLAAAALAGGVRDWRYLQRPIDPARPARVPPGLMDRALARFPDDPQVLLERALAAAARFNMMVDGGRLAPTIPQSLSVLTGRGQLSLPQLDLAPPEPAAALLAALQDDPLVGAEARLRLGYLQWALGRDEAASAQLASAAGRTADADIRYLAQFLLGSIAVARGDSAGAISRLEAALAARPAAQSAALVLAALELQRGDAGKAHEIARASLDRRLEQDPWRQFLYGHHPRWPALVAELRRGVKP
jgi:tetratricopeptide (TPR) repeat protein